MESNVIIKEEFYPDDIEECWEDARVLQNVELKQEDNNNLGMCQEVQSIKVETDTDGQDSHNEYYLDDFIISEVHDQTKEETSSLLDVKANADECLDEETCLNNFMNTDITIEDEIKDKGSGTYKCTICKKKFRSEKSLSKHKPLHNRTFKCTICTKSYSQKAKLKQHVLLHSGVKPFKCTICDKAYTRNENLKQHLWLHSEDNPFKCPICNAVFSLMATLSQHVLIHSEIKPFNCTHCDKGFNSKSNLLQHMVVHNKTNTGKDKI